MAAAAADADLTWSPDTLVSISREKGSSHPLPAATSHKPRVVNARASDDAELQTPGYSLLRGGTKTSFARPPAFQPFTARPAYMSYDADADDEEFVADINSRRLCTVAEVKAAVAKRRTLAIAAKARAGATATAAVSASATALPKKRGREDDAASHAGPQLLSIASLERTIEALECESYVQAVRSGIKTSEDGISSVRDTVLGPLVASLLRRGYELLGGTLSRASAAAVASSSSSSSAASHRRDAEAFALTPAGRPAFGSRIATVASSSSSSLRSTSAAAAALSSPNVSSYSAAPSPLLHGTTDGHSGGFSPHALGGGFSPHASQRSPPSWMLSASTAKAVLMRASAAPLEPVVAAMAASPSGTSSSGFGIDSSGISGSSSSSSSPMTSLQKRELALLAPTSWRNHHHRSSSSNSFGHGGCGVGGSSAGELSGAGALLVPDDRPPELFILSPSVLELVVAYWECKRVEEHGSPLLRCFQTLLAGDMPDVGISMQEAIVGPEELVPLHRIRSRDQKRSRPLGSSTTSSSSVGSAIAAVASKSRATVSSTGAAAAAGRSSSNTIVDVDSDDEEDGGDGESSIGGTSDGGEGERGNSSEIDDDDDISAIDDDDDDDVDVRAAMGPRRASSSTSSSSASEGQGSGSSSLPAPAQRLTQKGHVRDIESNLRALLRLRRLRQQMERLRIVLDTTRRREKLKRDRARAVAAAAAAASAPLLPSYAHSSGSSGGASELASPEGKQLQQQQGGVGIAGVARARHARRALSSSDSSSLSALIFGWGATAMPSAAAAAASSSSLGGSSAATAIAAPASVASAAFPYVPTSNPDFLVLLRKLESVHAGGPELPLPPFLGSLEHGSLRPTYSRWLTLRPPSHVIDALRQSRGMPPVQRQQQQSASALHQPASSRRESTGSASSGLLRQGGSVGKASLALSSPLSSPLQSSSTSRSARATGGSPAPHSSSSSSGGGGSGSNGKGLSIRSGDASVARHSSSSSAAVAAAGGCSSSSNIAQPRDSCVVQ